MKNPEIARVLKENRKKNHYTISDVAEKLKEKNSEVAVKTIYGWESGQTQPDADTLLKLCDIYGISDILEAFGYMQETEKDEPSITLTAEEKELIVQYRSLPSMQDAVKKLLELDP
ncbi:MAG: helix-turn-helix transcriptional regulator [Lachnospiraceae bacterium]|nr:helix-turn-helix transcriptional regulator [Lachnospiraceae bacterium]